jgi:hypothetical protein
VATRGKLFHVCQCDQTAGRWIYECFHVTGNVVVQYASKQGAGHVHCWCLVVYWH